MMTLETSATLLGTPTPEYAALLMANSEDFSRIMQKVKFLQLEKEEAQK